MNWTHTLGAAVIMANLGGHAMAQDGSAGPSAQRLPTATRPEVYASHAMACTAHPLATQAALEVMRAGGSAVDGAIAANACLGLMEPTGCGVGGDLFAMVWVPGEKKLHGYNGSGRSPSGVTLETLKSILAEKKLEQIPQIGALSVTVPGCVDGWVALHSKFGKMTLSEVLAPAIRYAEEGFPVSPRIAEAWELSVKRFMRGGPGGGEFPGFVDQFAVIESDAGGAPLPARAPRAGEMWTNPELAAVYRQIGERGRDGFYRGEIPSAIERTLKSQLGHAWLTASDFASHSGEWVTPVSASYRGVDVWELPPNGQGIAALQILKIMEGYDVQQMGFGSPAYVHTFVEAKKLAFEDRARFYGDPAFVKTPVSLLISEEYATDRRGLINDRNAARKVDPGVLPSGGAGGTDTTYLTLADESGMMVSLIQSNYRGMGSGVVPMDEQGRTLGFMLQSRGEQFALEAGHPNVFAPSKRPFHTIIPAFATKGGEAWLSFGVMGGAMQPQGHAQIVMNLVDFGMSLQQAGDAPRIHHDGSTEPQGAVKAMSDGGVVNLEPGFASETIAELQKRGHVLKPAPTAVFGGYQAIMVQRGTDGKRVYVGASESRKDGQAQGY